MRNTYILVAVHAQTLNFIDHFCVVVALLCARLSDFSTHVLEEILRKTSVFRHFGSSVDMRA
jgi:hypothetical protein